MSINKNIDIKGKKLLISDSHKDENNIINQDKLINYTNKSKEVYKAGKSDYKIEITKSKSKSDMILNSHNNQKNDKYLENNFLKFQKTSINNQKENLNEKINLKINKLEEHNYMEKKNDSKTKKNNFEKFQFGNKRNSNKDFNEKILIQKKQSNEFQEIKENDEEQILILSNNKIENCKLFKDNNLNKNLNLNNNKENTNFNTIEIDKYSNKLKENKNNIIFNSNQKIESQKINNDKTNFKEKKSKLENNQEQENLSNNNRVLFKEINQIKTKNSKNSEEKIKNNEYTKKKTLFSIDIFKSKGNANIIDKNFKKGRSKNNLRESEKQSLLKIQKSILNESKNHQFSKNSYYGGISPIKIKVKNYKILENSIIHVEKQVKSEFLKFFI